MQQAIVVGGDHHNTLGMVRSLGSQGIHPDVFLVKERDRDVKTVISKFINKTLVFTTDQEVVDYLKQFEFSENKPVLFIGGDSIASCLDNNYDSLKRHYSFFNAHGNLTQWMNKETMCMLASKVGFNVPEHIVYQLGNSLPDTVKYPCITKAISSIDGSKADTTICQNREQLEDFLSTPNLCNTIQIEKFIEKEIEFQYIGLSLNRGETIVIPGHSHIDRPNGIQNTYYFEYKENDGSFNETLEKTKQFIKETGYSGIFSVEFLRGKDGTDYFLEMNFRNDGNAICVTDAGYNLPYIWYLYSTGQNYKHYIDGCKSKPVRYCPEYYYTLEYTYGEVPFFTWLKNLLRANSFTEYYPGDSSFWFWPKFSVFALKCMIKKVMIKFGLREAPKESIG